ncbi:MAG TPA: tetratricopeptide repeat protein [Methylocella sp.]|nr:tetratricopeptide repeat protein [Methylocella sp.]
MQQAPSLSSEPSAGINRLGGAALLAKPGGQGKDGRPDDDRPGETAGAGFAAEVFALLAKAAERQSGGPPGPAAGMDRAALFAVLEKLEAELKAYGSGDGFLDKKNFAKLEAGLRAWHSRQAGESQDNAGAEPARGTPSPQHRDKTEREGAEPQNASSGGCGGAEGREGSLEQFDRLTRELQNALAQLAHIEARQSGLPSSLPVSRIPRESFAGQAGESTLALLAKQIDLLRQQLTERFESGLAAAMLEVASLSKRLDEVMAAFEPLTALERLIADIQAKLDDTRRDLCKFLEESLLKPKPQDEAAERILWEIAGLRASQEDAARKAAQSMAALEESLGEITRQWVRKQTSTPAARPAIPGVSDPFAPIFADLARKSDESALAIGVKPSASAAALRGALNPVKPGGETAQKNDAPSDGEDFLIEPGLGFQARSAALERHYGSVPDKDVQDSGVTMSRTDFIAAARQASRKTEGGRPCGAPLAQPKSALNLGATLAAYLHRLFRAGNHRLMMALAALLAVLAAVLLAGVLSQAGAGRALTGIFKRQTGVISAKPPESPPAGGVPKMQSLRALPFAQLITDPGQQNAAKAAQDAQAPKAAASSNPPGRSEPWLDPGSPFGDIFSPPALSGAKVTATGFVPSSSRQAPSAPPAAGNAVSQAIPAIPQAREAPPPPSEAPQSAALAARAQSGDAAAQFELARRYAQAGGTRNYELAAQWFGKAAMQGHAIAEFRLGSLYERGLGVARDLQRARELYQRAAEKGNVRAMHNLGVLAAEGPDGKPNYASAALWFGKAADFGIRDSQYNVAVLLARGLGVPKDLLKSYTWFAVVAASGDADAARRRDEIAARLTTSELASASAAAASFRPREPDPAVNETPAPQAGGPPEQAAPLAPKVSGL